MSTNQVTLTCVYLALSTLLPKELYLKILAIKKCIPISRSPCSSVRVKCSLIIRYSYSTLYSYSLCLMTEYILYRHRKALFFSLDLWNWPGHFSQPYLAARFELVHTAVVESCSTKQNSRMARAWKKNFFFFPVILGVRARGIQKYMLMF